MDPVQFLVYVIAFAIFGFSMALIKIMWYSAGYVHICIIDDAASHQEMSAWFCWNRLHIVQYDDQSFSRTASE